MVEDMRGCTKDMIMKRKNETSKRILDFVLLFDIILTNMFHKDEHLITFRSGFYDSQIDFFLRREIDQTRGNIEK